MFEVGVVGRFEAAHQLRGDFGPATRTHGHTYRVEVSIRGDALREDGTLSDMARLREALDAVLARLDYQDLDSVPGLAGKNTTAEVVARFIHEALVPSLRGEPVDTMGVRVWESPEAFAEFQGPIC